LGGSSNLPLYARGDPLILIGGPVSNSLAREWQGYGRSPSTGYVEDVLRRRPQLRWRFRYNLCEDKKAGPARFVDGKLHRSWPQAIEDFDKPGAGLRKAVTVGEDHWLVSDWLVLSFVRNTLSVGSGASIIDSSDLHGQGNMAFAQLMNDPWRLDELEKKLESRGIPHGGHFQALYRVDVVHKSEKTVLDNYYLVDVARIESLGHQ
jgi:hypothetical protein